MIPIMYEPLPWFMIAQWVKNISSLQELLDTLYLFWLKSPHRPMLLFTAQLIFYCILSNFLFTYVSYILQSEKVVNLLLPFLKDCCLLFFVLSWEKIVISSYFSSFVWSKSVVIKANLDNIIGVGLIIF